MRLVYQLARSYLSVNTSVVWSWDAESGVEAYLPLGFEARVVLAADPLSARDVDLHGGSDKADVRVALRMTPDGRLTSLQRTADGKRDEAVLALVSGILAGVSPASREGGAEGAEEEEEAAAGDEEEAEAAGEEEKEEEAAGAGEDEEEAGEEAEEADEEAGAGDEEEAAAGDTEDEGDDAKTAKPPVGNETTTDPEYFSDVGPRSLRLYFARYPRDKQLYRMWTVRHRSILAELSNAAPDKIEALITTLTAVRTELGTLETSAQTWLQEHIRPTMVKGRFDLDLWDLPLESKDAAWKTARGQQQIAGALEAADRPKAPENSPDRLDTHSVTAELFHQCGLVFAVSGLERAGADRNDDGVVNERDTKEDRSSALAKFRGLRYRQPYQVTLSCYRLTPHPDPAQRRLQLAECQVVPVVTEVSSVRELLFATAKDAEHAFSLELSELGTPSDITLEDKSEWEARLKLYGSLAERAGPPAISVVEKLADLASGPVSGALRRNVLGASWGGADMTEAAEGAEPGVFVVSPAAPESMASVQASKLEATRRYVNDRFEALCGRYLTD